MARWSASTRPSAAAVRRGSASPLRSIPQSASCRSSSRARSRAATSAWAFSISPKTPPPDPACPPHPPPPGFALPPHPRGALVQTAEPGLPAAKAGLQPGDIIIEADGRPITSNRSLIDYISYLPVGSKINPPVIRGGKRQTLTASTVERTLEADKDDATKQPEEAAPARNKLGMSVQELTPQTRQSYGIADNVTGVVVTGVKEVSPAGDVLNEGDVISEVAGTKVSNLAQFRTAIDNLKSGQIARIYVTSSGRGGAAISGYRFIHVP